jgi:hypothetical protein
MMGIQIKCRVDALSQKYADGLERVELFVCSEFTTSIVKPEEGQRLPITLVTPQGKYRGG